MPAQARQERWIEINLDHVEANAHTVRQHLPQTCKLLAVVKADAYGLGAVQVAHALEALVDMLAVSTVEEGVELRRHGIKTPILVFIPPTAHTVRQLVAHQLIATIDSRDSWELLQHAGANDHPCHLKINTGMNRFGVDLSDAAALAHTIINSNCCALAGVYSHLAQAADSEATMKQIQTFERALNNFKEMNLDYGLAHLANSTAIIKWPQSHFDMVRAGTIIYGQSPVKMPDNWQLLDPWQAYCRIVAVREVERGQAVGYGGDFVAKKDMRIGIIPFGYADGFAMDPNTRNGSIGTEIKKGLKNIGRLLAKRPLHYTFYQEDNKIHKIPIVGRVGMQVTAVDLTNSHLKKDDIIRLSLRRTAASARICRLYYQQGELIEERTCAADPQQKYYQQPCQ